MVDGYCRYHKRRIAIRGIKKFYGPLNFYVTFFIHNRITYADQPARTHAEEQAPPTLR
jgi:hypothetical protein